MWVAKMPHFVSTLFSTCAYARPDIIRQLVSLVTCPFSSPFCCKPSVFSLITRRVYNNLGSLLLYTGVIMNDPPTHREPMKNQRKYASRIADAALQVPMAQHQRRIGA